MIEEFDVAVIGAGMAGAAAAADLAADRRVVILERESLPGYHSTGRSAAHFSETYGNAVIRALSRASRPFLFDPPEGFAGASLTSPRPSLRIGRADQIGLLEALRAQPGVAGAACYVDGVEVERLCPLLQKGYAAAALYERDSADIDVDALHQGYLRKVRRQGGRVVTHAEAMALRRHHGSWHIATSAGQFKAPLIINAAGAWADEIAQLAGARPIGIEPRRRTGIVVDGPADLALDALPLTIDIGEQFYFKPDAGRVLLSPADETPSPPCDAQPDEMDVAVAIERVERATRLQVRRVVNKWAGLRCFVHDRSPVIGFDAEVPGFFWIAALGGYGIQTAPAVGRLAAAMAAGSPPPADLAELGFDAAAVAPDRLGWSCDERRPARSA